MVCIAVKHFATMKRASAAMGALRRNAAELSLFDQAPRHPKPLSAFMSDRGSSADGQPHTCASILSPSGVATLIG
jgi:hypothetical protein